MNQREVATTSNFDTGCCAEPGMVLVYDGFARGRGRVFYPAMQAKHDVVSDAYLSFSSLHCRLWRRHRISAFVSVAHTTRGKMHSTIVLGFDLIHS